MSYTFKKITPHNKEFFKEHIGDIDITTTVVNEAITTTIRNDSENIINKAIEISREINNITQDYQKTEQNIDASAKNTSKISGLTISDGAEMNIEQVAKNDADISSAIKMSRIMDSNLKDESKIALYDLLTNDIDNVSKQDSITDFKKENFLDFGVDTNIKNTNINNITENTDINKNDFSYSDKKIQNILNAMVQESIQNVKASSENEVVMENVAMGPYSKFNFKQLAEVKVKAVSDIAADLNNTYKTDFKVDTESINDSGNKNTNTVDQTSDTKVTHKKLNIGSIIGGIVAIIIVFILIGVGITLYKKFNKKKNENINYDNDALEKDYSPYEFDNNEISENITQSNPLNDTKQTISDEYSDFENSLYNKNENNNSLDNKNELELEDIDITQSNPLYSNNQQTIVGGYDAYFEDEESYDD